MGAYLADALRRRIARQEADGDTDGAKATEKRLKAVEKTDEAAQADVEAEPEAAKAEMVEVVDEPKRKPGRPRKGT